MHEIKRKKEEFEQIYTNFNEMLENKISMLNERENENNF